MAKAAETAGEFTAQTVGSPQSVKKSKTAIPSRYGEGLKGKINFYYSKVAQNKQLYFMLLPTIVFIFIFNYIPMYGIQIAFRDYIGNLGVTGSPWVGFKHFERFFNSFYFERLLTNTLAISIYQLSLFGLPIIFALMINELKTGILKRFSQTISYGPKFISVVVVVGMIVAMFDPVGGVINNFIQFFGGEPIDFLTSPEWFRHLYVWSGIWQNLGYSSIIYLAALTGVNPELHEAAIMDGASRMRRLWHINLPGIKNIIIVMFILEIGSFMSVGFEKALLLQNSLNSETSQIIQTFVYETGLLQGQHSYGAAVGLFNSVINLILIIAARFIVNYFNDTKEF